MNEDDNLDMILTTFDPSGNVMYSACAGSQYGSDRGYAIFVSANNSGNMNLVNVVGETGTNQFNPLYKPNNNA